jgi:hypothetical protein
MQLPTYEECESAIEKKTDTALHRFIQANCPAGIEECELFYTQLEDLIAEFILSDVIHANFSFTKPQSA